MRNDIMLVSSGYDHHIRFWSDFNNNKCKHAIEYKEGVINALEIIPSKEFIAFGANNSIKFIDLINMNNTPTHSIESHQGIVNNLLFPKDSDNIFLSSGEDSSIKMNDIRICKSVKEFNHDYSVTSITVANNNVN